MVASVGGLEGENGVGRLESVTQRQTVWRKKSVLSVSVGSVVPERGS